MSRRNRDRRRRPRPKNPRDPLGLDEVYAASQRVQMADPLIIAMDTENEDAVALAERLLGAEHAARHMCDPFIVATVDWNHPFTTEIVRHLFSEEEYETISKHRIRPDHYRVLLLLTHPEIGRTLSRYTERKKPPTPLTTDEPPGGSTG